jgi:cell division protein ZapB
MADNDSTKLSEIIALEGKLDDLIKRYDTLQIENRSLKTKQEELVREKAKLIEKTSTARHRVESMISRLKSMEHGA